MIGHIAKTMRKDFVPYMIIKGEIMMENDLFFWRENLKVEKDRLQNLFKFSNGVENSATMDAKRKIKRYEVKIEELEKSSMHNK